ncbi:amidohydrolase family protein [Flavisolibacter ginsengisoli]|jgi:imidazolonepropionase-like amidohydrolase|uniref:Imidazolonepropionase n=1 Tax=Flavisolibacter ginsengisoli DSM 18119 TaxID=1121884 RepID=A0A1M5FDC5_9BACT|nr:amidohydrolase family protein [Flavisolibacter ginsengisoli]SHF89550.1 Imidazolonepropionase [Flavisolibacter ginsengisoli DSM 18119]
MRKAQCFLLSCTLLIGFVVHAQTSFPVNGVADERSGYYVFTNATIVKDAATTLSSATMVIKDGVIKAIGKDIAIPKDAVTIDCKGRYIYPSFIDIYTDYGMPVPQPGTGGFNFFGPTQFNSATKGAYGWNQAIKSEVDAYRSFAKDEAKANSLRELGFGTVLTHIKDGIARGTGALVTLANDNENFSIIKEKASANYSFNKGTSTQSYPGSMMGMIALLRQTYLDAQWYKQKPPGEGLNLSLQAWLDNQSLPQIFDAGDKWNDLRADRIGDEFGVQYIIKGGGNEYQRIKEVKATNATYIISLNFPQAMDVEDPNDARFVSVSDMKHWELAPTNPAALEKAGIPFCLTTSDLRDMKQFTANLKLAFQYGLSEQEALNALTKTPATALGVYSQVGSLDAGKLANFIITSGPVFNEKTQIIQNWIRGKKYGVKDDIYDEMRGKYKLVLNTVNGPVNYTLDFKSPSSASLIGKDTVTSKFYFDGRQVRINVAPERRLDNNLRLSGMVNGTQWSGTGEDSSGNRFTWTASYSGALAEKVDSARKRPSGALGKVTYPFLPFGWEEGQAPRQETILVKNATVWTNEKDGVLQNTDVLIRNGKIAAVGKNLQANDARIIDGTGKHVTPGIIDEHSHIAASSINEGGQSVTSEVRIADNLNPDDINIYRQLSGGVTTSHILHGSANTIGGQTQLIKLRWGANDEDLKFKGSAPFIKFALGENVKRSPANAGQQNRFPDTRMGVEEVLTDAFTRAKDYERSWKEYESARNKKGMTAPRKDLELDALVEILNNKRFITCHSYVQSEITSAMRVADKMGYKVNTFTHILEGYKVADKMKAHGANASTFSDWWAYKMEVQDAIPYNAAIMSRVGLNVAINSDDAEMARRLNQEAAKIVKYGGVSEEEALKMVTLNPAKMLHVEDKVGSLKVGKDGDIVVWTDNPLSIYARPDYTIVDGTIYFDRLKDEQMQKLVDAERSRLVKKMIGEKRSGAPVQQAIPSYEIMHSCSEHMHSHGLLVIDASEAGD